MTWISSLALLPLLLKCNIYFTIQQIGTIGEPNSYLK
jgi:hypothetical protein